MIKTLIDRLPQNRRLPEYYDEMYLDGFSPQEIMTAHSKMMRRLFLEKREKGEKNESENIEITIKEKKRP